MPAPRETRTIVQAARLYYEKNRSQSQIAQELEISRSNVSRILAQARERGIVGITIHDPDAPPVRDPQLEQALSAAFPGLTTVRVVTSSGSGLDAVAQEASDLMGERIPQVRSIGLSWGQTVQHVMARLPRIRLQPAPRVLPLVGGLSALDQLDSGDSVLRVLAERLGTRPEPLYAPAVLESALATLALLRESSISSVLEEAAKVELALVGIGSWGLQSTPYIVERMRLSAQERLAFTAQQPVGDVCGRFLKADGRPVGPPSEQRVLAVSVQQLAGIPDVIGVAADAAKAPGALGVLHSGVLDTLVVDAPLARAVLAAG